MLLFGHFLKPNVDNLFELPGREVREGSVLLESIALSAPSQTAAELQSLTELFR